MTLSDTIHNKLYINSSHLITYFYKPSKMEILEMSVCNANCSLIYIIIFFICDKWVYSTYDRAQLEQECQRTFYLYIYIFFFGGGGSLAGVDPWFSFAGGGGRKRLGQCAHSMQITSAKPNVPYGRGPALCLTLTYLGYFASLNSWGGGAIMAPP